MTQEKMSLEPGARFNTRTVISEAGKNKFGCTLYLARCDCGYEKVYPGSYIKECRNCVSCYVKPIKPKKERDKTTEDSLRKNPVDFIGQKFGKLTLLSVADTMVDGRKICVFSCECGNQIKFAASKVLCGRKTHCGCVKPVRVIDENKVTVSKEPIDLNGQTYGYLTFRDFAYRKKNHAFYNVECVCGNVKQLAAGNVKSGRVRSCGCKRGELLSESKTSDLIGKKFFMLTVVSKSHRNSDQHRTYFNCICDCGKECISSDGDLSRGRKKTCGCSTKRLISEARTLKDRQSNKNSIYRVYKHSAKKRGIDFDLEKQLLLEMIEKDCYYCGAPPSNEYNDKFHADSFRYNGIDRIDSNQGYKVGNIVTSCKNCNWAKRIQSQHDFYMWVDLVYHNKVKEYKKTLEFEGL